MSGYTVESSDGSLAATYLSASVVVFQRMDQDIQSLVLLNGRKTQSYTLVGNKLGKCLAHAMRHT